MSVHFGLGVFSGQARPGGPRTVADEYEDIVALAVEAERAGFDSVWVSEHHGADDGYLPSPLPILAAVAAVTDRIELGTAVVLAPFQHPLRFAEDCAVVDQLSRGRLVVGIGAGWRTREFEAFGLRRAERAARTEELVRICRAAWDEEHFSFAGRFASYADASVMPRPFRPIPILLGGTAPAAIERAGRLADGFIATPGNRVGTMRRQVETFDAAAAAAGRDPSRLPLAFHVDAWVSPDGRIPDDVQDAMWHAAATYIAWHAEDDGAPLDAMPPLDPDRLRQRAIAGTPREVVHEVRAWVDAFVGRDLTIIARLHYPGMDRADATPTIRLFAAEVMAAFGGSPNEPVVPS